MADISIFEQEEFQVHALAASISEQEYVPGRLGALGVFHSEGIHVPHFTIEKDGDKLALVASAERGAPGQVVTGSKRQKIPFMTQHLPQQSTIRADEIVGVKAFGSTTELEMMQRVIAKRQAKHRKQLDATIEFHRIGAARGKILDADGTTVLVDLFQRFGIAQQVAEMPLNDQNADLQTWCMELLDQIEDALGGITFTGVRVPCGRDFFRKFVAHKSVKEAYARYQEGAHLRADVRGGFSFGGIIWEQYRGQVGGIMFVPLTEAQVVIEGSDETYIERYAPADYTDTVGTEGLPYYSSIELLDHKKGISLESQSNVAALCTRPKAAINIRIKA